MSSERRDRPGRGGKGTDVGSGDPSLLSLIRTLGWKEGSFTLASGRTSTYYVDLRPVTLDPVGLRLASDALLQKVGQLPRATHVGGMAVGAVPLVAGLALASGAGPRPLRGFFVRAAAKGHGASAAGVGAGTAASAARARLGGNDPTGGDVVLVEDVTTTGRSTLDAVEVVRALPATVVAVLAVVDRQEGAADAFAGAGVPFQALLTVADLARR